MTLCDCVLCELAMMKFNKLQLLLIDQIIQLLLVLCIQYMHRDRL